MPSLLYFHHLAQHQHKSVERKKRTRGKAELYIEDDEKVWKYIYGLLKIIGSIVCVYSTQYLRVPFFPSFFFFLFCGTFFFFQLVCKMLAQKYRTSTLENRRNTGAQKKNWNKREKECETLLCVCVLCGAEGTHDRQQGCNFDTSFVSRRQTNLLARHLSLFLSLFRLHSFRVDPESLVAATGRSLIRLCLIRKEWKIARRLGCQSNSSSFLMNFFSYFFFFIFIFSYFFYSFWLYLHFPRAERYTQHKTMML